MPQRHPSGTDSGISALLPCLRAQCLQRLSWEESQIRISAYKSLKYIEEEREVSSRRNFSSKPDISFSMADPTVSNTAGGEPRTYGNMHLLSGCKKAWLCNNGKDRKKAHHRERQAVGKKEKSAGKTAKDWFGSFSMIMKWIWKTWIF